MLLANADFFVVYISENLPLPVTTQSSTEFPILFAIRDCIATKTGTIENYQQCKIAMESLNKILTNQLTTKGT